MGKKKKKAGKTNDVYILEFHSVRKRNHRYYNSNRRSCVTTRSKRSEKGQKSGTNRWRRIYRISFLDLSSCPSGASHFTFEFIRTGHRNLLFDRSPSSPPLFSNPGSTGPLLLPQRPRYFVVVSSSMPPFFVSCSPFVSFFDSLSLSPTPILSSQFHLAAFPSYIFFYFVFCLILQFLRILFILPEW